MPTERIQYTTLTDPRPRTRESFVDADDLPTNKGVGKVYLFFSGLPPIEFDISSGAKFVQDGPAKRLVSGHLRGLCPKCAFDNGRMSPLHIDAANKTVWVHEDEAYLFHYVPKSDPRRHYFLCTFSVLEICGCDYREPSVGACTWRAWIKEGRCISAAGGGQIFVGR